MSYPSPPLFVRPEWYDRAECSGVGPAQFFIERGASTAAAHALCQVCEVRLDCLDLALERGERFGMWGGFSVRERRRMLHHRRVAS